MSDCQETADRGGGFRGVCLGGIWQSQTGRVWVRVTLRWMFLRTSQVTEALPKYGSLQLKLTDSSAPWLIPEGEVGCG